MRLWVAAALPMLVSPRAPPCQGPPRAPPPASAGSAAVAVPGAPRYGAARQAAYAEAARAYGVPESVLLAVSYLHSRWDTHGGRPSVSGGFGPMHLVDAGHHHRPHALRTARRTRRGDESRPHRPPDPAPPPRFRRERHLTPSAAARLTGLGVATAARGPGGQHPGRRGPARRSAAPPRRSRAGRPAGWYGAVARLRLRRVRRGGLRDDPFRRRARRPTTASGRSCPRCRPCPRGGRRRRTARRRGARPPHPPPPPTARRPSPASGCRPPTSSSRATAATATTTARHGPGRSTTSSSTTGRPATTR